MLPEPVNPLAVLAVITEDGCERLRKVYNDLKAESIPEWEFGRVFFDALKRMEEGAKTGAIQARAKPKEVPCG